MSLTRQQVEAYETDGFLAPIRIMEEPEATRYQSLFDELEAREGREKCRIGLLDRHSDQEFIWEVATHPKILDCVEALIGPNLVLLTTHFFCKYGPDTKFVAWHQDVTYWGLEPPFAMTAWYAIDDSDRENGCVRVIPGTHRDGIREHGKSQQEGNLLSIDQEVPVTEDEERSAVDFILKTGEISLHHGALIHGSLPNRSTRRRCGMTIRFVPSWVKVVAESSLGKRYNSVLVRGEDPDGNHQVHEMPFPMKAHAG